MKADIDRAKVWILEPMWSAIEAYLLQGIRLAGLRGVESARCKRFLMLSSALLPLEADALRSWIRAPTAIACQPGQKQSMEPPYKPQVKSKKEWLHVACSASADSGCSDRDSDSASNSGSYHLSLSALGPEDCTGASRTSSARLVARIPPKPTTDAGHWQLPCSEGRLAAAGAIQGRPYTHIHAC